MWWMTSAAVRPSVGVEAHVQGLLAPAERKAAVRIQLGGRQAQVQHDPLHRRHARLVQHLAHRIVPPVDRHEPVPERRQAQGGSLQRLGIPIKTHETYGGRSAGQDGLGVSPLADRAVHHPPGREVGARSRYLLEEDGDVHAIHAQAPWATGGASRRPDR